MTTSVPLVPPNVDVYWTDGQVALLQGDVIERLRDLPDESVHMVCCSPPYWGLRDYGTADWEGGDAECGHLQAAGIRQDGGREQIDGFHGSSKSNLAEKPYRDACGKCGAVRVDQQIGLEATPEMWVERMVEVFREVRRVMRPEASLWLNVGDSYAQTSKHVTDEEREQNRARNESYKPLSPGAGGLRGAWTRSDRASNTAVGGLKPKDLCGMPWRLAFALQADGWWLRSEITWCKRAPMPESVTDRPTSATEKVFLLTKAERYFYDADAVRTEHADPSRYDKTERRDSWQARSDGAAKEWNPKEVYANPAGRNMWNYWLLGPEPYAAAHFATFPTEIPRRAILAGTSEKGCCADCGAPWRRVVEAGVSSWERRKADGDPIRYGLNGSAAPLKRSLGDKADRAAGGFGVPAKRSDTGWAPTCTHGAQVVPCAVLDPFIGSGTTTWVAKTLGRRGIGIDLSAEYLDLAVKRNQQMALELAI